MNSRSLARALRLVVPVAIVAAAAGYWYLHGPGTVAEEVELLQSVRVAYPERADLVRRETVHAHIEADEMVTVLPLVSGAIDEISVDVGDAVIADQVVVLIDPERYRLQLAQAEAAYRAAERTFTRTEQLHAANATTIQNVDQARANFDAAASQRALAQLQLDYATVRSPITGTVLARHSVRGDLAAPERPLVTIGNLDTLIVRAAVPEERYATFLQPDRIERVTVMHDGAAYAASIRSVAPYVKAETRTFEVVCDVAGDGTALRPGMSVSVAFDLERRSNVLTLPYRARGYGGTLWTVDGDVARALRVDPVFEGDDRFAIPEDFVDTPFVVDGHHFLTDGQRVRVVGEAR